jgi:hypothetical protein
MHRISTTLFGLGALAAVSCGVPADLDESQFPELSATGYTDGASGGTANGLPPNNTAGASATGGTVSGAGGTAGAPSVGAAGSASVPPAGGGASSMPGGTAGTNGASGGTGMAAGPGGCPDDITLLFNRPIDQGGCAGAACHIPGATRPDLVSPNPEERLLNVQSMCNAMPYIGDSPENSLIAAKITVPPDGCGLAMPFFMPQALSATDEACILAWVEEISGQ